MSHPQHSPWLYKNSPRLDNRLKQFIKDMNYVNLRRQRCQNLHNLNCFSGRGGGGYSDNRSAWSNGGEQMLIAKCRKESEEKRRDKHECLTFFMTRFK